MGRLSWSLHVGPWQPQGAAQEEGSSSELVKNVMTAAEVGVMQRRGQEPRDAAASSPENGS